MLFIQKIASKKRLHRIVLHKSVAVFTMVAVAAMPLVQAFAVDIATSSSIPASAIGQITNSASQDISFPIELPTQQIATETATPITNLPDKDPLQIQITNNQTQSISAKIRQKSKVKKLDKKIFRSNEAIKLTIEHPTLSQKILVTDAKGQTENIIVYRAVTEEAVEIVIPPPPQFTPGRFTMTVIDDSGILSQQDFSWGVLAINPDQSVYKTDSRAHLSITVLNDLGETLCNSNLTLKITAPDGTVSVYSTDNEGIVKTDDCGSLSATASDDYFTNYQFGNAEGVYQLELSATTDSGSKTISDIIKVSNQEPFYIKRSGPTRIYPPNWYDMKIQVTASESFDGTIVETLPESFTIQSSVQGSSFSSQQISPLNQSMNNDYLSLQLPFHEKATILYGYGETPPPEVRDLYEANSMTILDGVDFTLPEGTPILAVDAGKVSRVGGPYQNTIVIEHSWGKSYYGYLSDVLVQTGDSVAKGQNIGLSGKPEKALTSYLHFAMKRTQHDKNNGAYGKIDPLPYLSKDTVTSDINVRELLWNQNIGKGETITLAYRFKTPMISPQFYLAGPLKFHEQHEESSTDTNEVPTNSSLFTTELSTPSANQTDPRIASYSGSILNQTQTNYTNALDQEDTQLFLSLVTPTPVATETTNVASQTAKLTSEYHPPQTTKKLFYQEPRSWQIAADAIPNNLQVSTAEFYAGQYSGNGTTGQNSDTNQSFSTFNFNLAETNVSIKQLIIFFEAQYSAYSDEGTFNGWDLAFDACVESCTANAWGGSGAVTVSDTSVLAYNETESVTTRLLANVASETTIASYTGGGTNLEAQVGYSINDGSAANSIAQAKAKILVTYTYSPTSQNYTNTVKFPLESTQAGDQGTRRNSISGGCTRNSTCPVFDYNVDLGESSVTEQSSWFRTEYFNDTNSGNDITQNVNMQGTDTNSSNVILEAARGSAQGNGQSAYFSGVSGYAIQTAKQLEVYHSTGTIYGIGGEVVQTYSAPASSTTKTKTVSFPFGVVSNGSTTTAQTATTTVYLPERGVSVKKAWFRIYSSNITSSSYNLQIRSTVEGTAETSAVQYDINSGGDVPLPAFTLFHVIDSSYYSYLEGATATNGIDVTIKSTANNTNIGGVSAELMLTFTYTDDSQGYLASATIMGGQQTTDPSTSYTTSAGAIDPYFPEQNGVKTIRGAMLDASILTSDSDGNAPGGNVNVDATLSSGTCTNTVAYDVKTDNMTAFEFWVADVSSSLTTNDATTYTACMDNDADALDSSQGGKHNMLLYYLYQVDLPTLTQLMRHGKWFDNTGTRQAFTF